MGCGRLSFTGNSCGDFSNMCPSLPLLRAKFPLTTEDLCPRTGGTIEDAKLLRLDGSGLLRATVAVVIVSPLSTLVRSLSLRERAEAAASDEWDKVLERPWLRGKVIV